MTTRSSIPTISCNTLFLVIGVADIVDSNHQSEKKEEIYWMNEENLPPEPINQGEYSTYRLGIIINILCAGIHN